MASRGVYVGIRQGSFYGQNSRSHSHFYVTLPTVNVINCNSLTMILWAKAIKMHWAAISDHKEIKFQYSRGFQLLLLNSDNYRELSMTIIMVYFIVKAKGASRQPNSLSMPLTNDKSSQLSQNLLLVYRLSLVKPSQLSLLFTGSRCQEVKNTEVVNKCHHIELLNKEFWMKATHTEYPNLDPRSSFLYKEGLGLRLWIFMQKLS